MNARQRLIGITLAALLAMGLTAALGRWQLQRAADKEALQARMDSHSERELVQASTLQASADPLGLVHHHARLRGQWVPEHTVYLDNRQMNAKVGFYVLTPLRLEGSQQAILVQRGWAPRNFVARDKLPEVQTPPGTVTLEGRIAPPPSKLFELGSPATTAIRQNLDIEQFREQSRLPLMPVMLTQTGAPTEGLLREWPAVNLGIEKHYGYALQWFAMTLVIALLYLWYQILKPATRRTKDSKPHA